MSNLDSRVKRLEGNVPVADLPIWAELLDDGGAVLRYADGTRVPVREDEIPFGVKVYQGTSPDDWFKTNEPTTTKQE